MRSGGIYCNSCGKRLTPADESTPLPRQTIYGPDAAVSPPGIPDTTVAPGAPATHGTAPLSLRGAVDPALPAQRRVVTVLFTDISGFTRFSADQDPETVSEMVNELFCLLTEPIYRYGGIVDKYIGDAIMAVFGAPIAHEDDPVRALRAALEMQQAAESYFDALEARSGKRLAIRIGLNTGLVVAGAVGTGRKSSYTVLGDAVNVAQRLEAAAGSGSVLVGEDTWRLAQEAFAFESAGPLELKGRDGAVLAWRVVGPAEGRVDLGSLPLVGRDAELAELGRAWSDAYAGQPLAIYVRGPAGMGKTGLLSGVFPETAVWARCTPFEVAEPLGLLRRLVRSLLDLAPQERDPEGLEKALRAKFPTTAEDAETRELLALLLFDRVSEELAGMGPEHRKAMIFKAAAGLFAQRAKAESLAVVIDDLHWIDDGSAEFLQPLLKGVAKAKARFLLAAGYRPGVRIVPMPGGLVPYREIDLAPLDVGSARELLAAALPAGDRDETSLAALLERAGGNPRYLKAFAEHAREAEAAGVPPRDGLPLPVLSRLAAEIDAIALSPDAKAALEALAVLGGQGSEELLGELAGSPEGDVPWVGELRDRGLIDADPATPRGIVMADRLFQEALYGRLLLAQRRKLHSEAAALLDRAGQAPAIVAEHYAAAERAPEAADAFLRAAERSIALFSNHEALRMAAAARKWAEQGVSGPDIPEFERRVLAVEAEGTAESGDFHRALDFSARLIERSPRKDLAQAYSRHADYLSRMGKHKEALETCEIGKAKVGEGSIDVLWLVARAVNSRLQTGDAKTAIAEIEWALDHAPEREFKLRGLLLGNLGLAQLREGKAEQAVESFRAALDSQQRAGNLYGAAHCLNNLGSACQELGQVQDAQRYLNRGLQVATRIGDRRLVSMLMNNLGKLEFERGEVERAKECFQKALEAHRDMHDRQGEGIALVNLGEVLSTMGQLDAAQTTLLEAAMVLEEIGLKSVLAETYRELARIKMGQERYREALELLQRSAGLARDTGRKDLYGAVLRLLAEVYHTLDRLEDAITWAARSLETLKAITAPLELGRTYALLTKLLVETGKLPQAQEAAKEAQSLFEQSAARQEIEKFSPLAEMLLAGKP
jgi:class 3 adenylate cyclase/tetratricopeptide (TPR) repeat protein